MKKVAVFLSILFFISACAPPQKVIQEAVSQTLTAVPPSIVPEVTATALSQPTEAVSTTTSTTIPTAMAKSCSEVNGIELLTKPWRLEGDNSSAEAEQKVATNILQGKTTLLITYDLHGLTTHEGERKDESAIIFDQPHWYVISLANYGQNGLDGAQTIEVPLSDFIGLPDAPSNTPGGTPLNLDQPVNMLHARFWSSSHFIVDVSSICAFSS